ncbi:MAG: efflux RND transporter periplasmic adaptor subunit [Candidatus Krumholzibacteriota bacterium]|nr:efflux RND transporter periplasmic adaptor subunit [Candidatus Krumholzibacteriota bacterium]
MKDVKRKKVSYGRYLVIVAFLIIIAAFAYRFNTVSSGTDIESIGSIHQKEGRPVEVVPVETSDIKVWQTIAGTVEGIIQYPIVSTNSIQVMDILKREGDRVRGGDVVIRLEKTAANPMLHSYERSRALYENTLQETRRVRNLFDEGAVSRQTLDQAEMALKIAESDLRDAREGIDLVADHPGVVMSLMVEKGEMAENGKPLAWIARTDSVRVAFEAGSRQAIALSEGQKAVWRDAGSGWSGEGSIGRIDLAADPETHLVSGEALFPNADGKLIPGLLLSFQVLTGDRKGVLTVPTRCVIRDEMGQSVFALVTDDGGKTRVVLRRINTGLGTSDRVEVLSGLSDGEKVVLFGQSMIKDGDLVKVIAGGEAD